jgi:hypothetical protein
MHDIGTHLSRRWNYASDAGGLLLTLRKGSTAFILSLLSSVLKPLARLSKSLQSGTGDIVNAMQHALAVKNSLSQMIESNFAVVESTSNDMIRSAETAGVFIEPDTSSLATVQTMAKKYVQLIIGNMNERFNDSVGQIADLHVVLKEKPQIADFSKLCQSINQ